ncbi:iron only hydrogenase large subunit-like protein [Anaerosolibacter carboniphilus]|uniref:Iron only hydrogenase large subunit-like protein n=1 Tax=Anaerosolibacter carboniphilus TaxID=1417629 RepID=A0A841KWW5_9FIRM|nr:hypothetical protein [Anaerosolibacter carboniphilus]MBB6215422.1 iron only hydrogenase large subunit-like protein [Anaerosolibacter carboniphilus]
MGCCGGGHQNHHSTRNQTNNEMKHQNHHQEKNTFSAYLPMFVVLGLGLAVLYFFK